MKRLLAALGWHWNRSTWFACWAYTRLGTAGTEKGTSPLCALANSFSSVSALNRAAFLVPGALWQFEHRKNYGPVHCIFFFAA
jgi:hypothetical protein